VGFEKANCPLDGELLEELRQRQSPKLRRAWAATVAASARRSTACATAPYLRGCVGKVQWLQALEGATRGTCVTGPCMHPLGALAGQRGGMTS